jgi:hypothetical protein
MKIRREIRRLNRFTVGRFTSTLLIISMLLGGSTAIGADPMLTEGPQYDAQGKLVRPVNYREWVNIGTGLGMAYGPLREKAGTGLPFTNVFVNPASYRSFLQNGAWPDRTVFVLEVRSSTSMNNSATGNNGHFQGEIVGIEAEVKDEKRFEKGWAFFSLSMSEPAGSQIPTNASCYACHATNGAVENTFTQFYPVLRDVAKKHGTFKNVPEVF